MNGDDILTPAEVAEQLKIAKNTVYELIKRGELEAYRVGKKIRVECRAVEALKEKREGSPPVSPIPRPGRGNSEREDGHPSELIICGQDITLDILARRLETHPLGLRVFRSHMGSYNALYSLYLGEVQIATAHMWDSASDSYNVPYISKMVPGMDAAVIHMARRFQGLYVGRGNPLGIRDWEDLLRPEVRFVNRERGSGTRILLDGYFQSRGWDPERIRGYGEVSTSHMACASRVGRGDADAALGCEKGAMQVPSVEFIPLKEESYDMILFRKDLDRAPFRAVREILRDPSFRREIEGLGGYDVSRMGELIYPVR